MKSPKNTQSQFLRLDYIKAANFLCETLWNRTLSFRFRRACSLRLGHTQYYMYTDSSETHTLQWLHTTQVCSLNNVRTCKCTWIQTRTVRAKYRTHPNLYRTCTTSETSGRSDEGQRLAVRLTYKVYADYNSSGLHTIKGERLDARGSVRSNCGRD